MDMPDVKSCDVLECAYNKQRECHAIAITIGDSNMPKCDTFWAGKQSASDAGDPKMRGRVGACHSSQCEYNERLECTASGIQVGYQNESPNCLTYEPAEAKTLI